MGLGSLSEVGLVARAAEELQGRMCRARGNNGPGSAYLCTEHCDKRPHTRKVTRARAREVGVREVGATLHREVGDTNREVGDTLVCKVGATVAREVGFRESEPPAGVKLTTSTVKLETPSPGKLLSVKLGLPSTVKLTPTTRLQWLSPVKLEYVT
jgi:hypothetical protein